MAVIAHVLSMREGVPVLHYYDGDVSAEDKSAKFLPRSALAKFAVSASPAPAPVSTEEPKAAEEAAGEGAVEAQAATEQPPARDLVEVCARELLFCAGDSASVVLLAGAHSAIFDMSSQHLAWSYRARQILLWSACVGYDHSVK